MNTEYFLHWWRPDQRTTVLWRNPASCLLFLLLGLAIAAPVAGQPADTLLQVHCQTLDTIVLSGKHKTKRSVILRELSVQPGDCLPADSLALLAKTNRLRLLNLSLFNEVQITWNPLPSGLSMNIYVIDRFPIFPDPTIEFADRNFNVWWKEQNRDLRRINLGLTLVDNNFRGNREVIALTGQIGYTRKAGISYSIPFADKAQKQGFGFSVFGLLNREVAYRTENNKLSFFRDPEEVMLRQWYVSGWYTLRPAYAVEHQATLSFRHYAIDEKIAALNPEYLGNGHTREQLLTFSYRYQYNGVDNWNYPLTGNRFIGVVVQDIRLNNAGYKTSLQLQYDQYYHPFRNWYVGLIFRGQTSFPQQQPYILRRNLGYDYNYIRGFEYYVIDGSTFGLLRLDVKRKLLDIKLHLPLRYFEVIPIRVYAKVFGDAGFSYNKFAPDDLLSNRGLFASGLGIDLITLYDIKLRIEYTFNSLGEKGLFLHKSGE